MPPSCWKTGRNESWSCPVECIGTFLKMGVCSKTFKVMDNLKCCTAVNKEKEVWMCFSGVGEASKTVKVASLVNVGCWRGGSAPEATVLELIVKSIT